jgi:hypothetical protein
MTLILMAVKRTNPSREESYITPQATNRRDVMMSCCGSSRKIRAFTENELETMKAGQKLLGAPTIGGGSARAWGGGGGS